MNIVDTHVHFWDVDSLSYPWIAKGSAFDRSFLPQDYARATAEIPIERAVFVECDARADCSLAEAEWAVRLAQADPRIQAIVARVSLMDAAAVATLDAMATMPLVRGIRDNIQGHGPGFALQAEFVAGVREVHRRGLHFELCIEHHQLAEAIELVKRCREGRFVLDHCAKPGIKSGRKEPWAQQMREMAAQPNVVCKISGLATEADWAHWQADEVLGYAGIAAEAFGPERILFGSDWPVNELAGGSLRWFRVAESLASRWSAADQARFFRGNAERVYRLDSSSK